MQPEDFKPDDLFAQIQGLVDALSAERTARERAETSERAKAQLLSVIGHELRTPMRAVLSIVERLLSGSLDPNQRRYAETLDQSVRSLHAVLNDVLYVAQLDAGYIELDCETYDLHELVQEAAAAVRARAAAKGLTIGLDIGFSCPRFVIGDAARLRQILDAVINGAIERLPQGSVRLHARARDGDGHLRLRFDIVAGGPELSQAAQQPGGLGTSIARQLIDMMGGQIGSESVAGQGSVMWFTVAAARAPELRATPMPQKEPVRAGVSGHVLVVEGNAVNRMLLGTYLDEFGLTHEMVGSAAEAILALVANRYDLLLMDVASPVFEAAQFIQQVRGLSAPAGRIPIVALTAAQGKDGSPPPIAGADASVAKPIRGRELHAALAPFLGFKEQRRAAAG